MIPNALANTGPTAMYWGYLKSIDYALDRLLEEKNITYLDKDRLKSLSKLLESIENDAFSESEFEYYSIFMDLQTKIKTIQKFDEWKNNLRFDKKIQNLRSSIDKYLKKSEETQIGGLQNKVIDDEKEKFEVLKSIIQSLLYEAEISLR